MLLRAADSETVNAVAEMLDTSAVTAVEASSIITTGEFTKARLKVMVQAVGEPVPVVTLPTESVEPVVTVGEEPQEETTGVPGVEEAMM